MLFRGKKYKEDENSFPVSNKIAKEIASCLLRAQSKFAEAMNAETKNISPKSMKWLLAVFCLPGVGFSLYLIAKSVIEPNVKQSQLKIEKVNIPQYYHMNGNEYLQTGQYVNTEIYQSIEQFESYMDSLQQKEKGRKIHDSILAARPGLMDSIAMLKEIYDSQIK